MVAPIKNQIKSNFIRNHLIKEIFQRSYSKKKILGVRDEDFIYFDEPIDCNYYQINRFGRGNFFFTEQILPVSWTSIDAKILMSAFDKLKKNKVFVIKEINGRPAKTRVRNVRK